jgi:hypothetical protein
VKLTIHLKAKLKCAKLNFHFLSRLHGPVFNTNYGNWKFTTTILRTYLVTDQLYIKTRQIIFVSLQTTHSHIILRHCPLVYHTTLPVRIPNRVPNITLLNVAAVCDQHSSSVLGRFRLYYLSEDHSSGQMMGQYRKIYHDYFHIPSRTHFTIIYPDTKYSPHFI